MTVLKVKLGSDYLGMGREQAGEDPWWERAALFSFLTPVISPGMFVL